VKQRFGIKNLGKQRIVNRGISAHSTLPASRNAGVPASLACVDSRQIGRVLFDDMRTADACHVMMIKPAARVCHCAF